MDSVKKLMDEFCVGTSTDGLDVELLRVALASTPGDKLFGYFSVREEDVDNGDEYLFVTDQGLCVCKKNKAGESSFVCNFDYDSIVATSLKDDNNVVIYVDETFDHVAETITTEEKFIIPCEDVEEQDRTNEFFEKLIYI